MRIDSRILERLRHRGCRERHCSRYVGPVLDLDIFLFVELVRDFACNLHYEARGVKAGDSANSALAILGGLPKALSANTIWADSPDSGDHCATHRFSFAFGPNF